MGLRYILGRTDTGKTHLVYEEIKKELNRDEHNKLILLVPEQFTLEAEADLISKMDLDGIMRLEVLSFSRLAVSILNEVGGIKKTAIDTIGKIMILRKLFEENLDELEVFKKGFNQEGFLEGFCELISEFKRNNVGTEELDERIESLPKDNMLKRKLRDINLMYKKFNEYLEGSYRDQDDKINIAIEKLEDSRYFKNAEIWIDGFNTFSAQEYLMLEKLLLKVKKVNMTLTIDLDKMAYDYDLFDPTRGTYQRLEELASKFKIPTELVYRDKPHNLKTKEIIHLEQEFFSYPYRVYTEQSTHISLFSAMNQYTEIENIAIDIISLARDKGYRWRDISVVCNTLEIYNPIIKRVFTEYGIPHFLDETRNIMNNPIIKFLLSSLEVLVRNFRYDDVFKNIKTGLTNLTKAEYEKLENYVLEKGIRGNTWFKDFEYFGSLEDEWKAEKLEELFEINKIRQKFVEPFLKLKEKITKKNTVKDLTQYLFEFFMELHLEDQIEELIEVQRMKNNLEYVNENTQIWNTIMEVFDQLVEILDDKTISIKDYIKVLESGLVNIEIGIIPPTMDQVLVGNLERSKSQDIKAQFVIGVNDGLLPSNFIDGGIILDDEKVIMKQSGIELYSDNDTKVKEERFRTYQAFTKPSEYLFVSYSLGDAEGKALRPSTLIDRFKKVFGIEVRSDLIKNHESSMRLISRPSSTIKYLTESLRESLDGTEIFDEWWDVYDWYYNTENFKSKLGLVIDGLFHSNQEGNIDEHYARKLYNVPFKTNISSLETFVNCPFSYFIKKGLRPKERKEYEVSMPDVGTLFHDSIEAFSKELTLENLSWNDITREKSDQLVEKVLIDMMDNFQNGVLTSSHRYKYLTNKLERVSKRALWVLTEHLKTGEFVPLEHELFFGEREGGIPPIVIELPNGEQVILEGRIDRVDVLRDGKKTYLKVIDYKSGSKKFELSDLYYGLQIQLIVYLDAVLTNSEQLVKTESFPAGAFYFKIDDPMVNGVGGDKDSIEQAINKELKMDGLVVKNIDLIEKMDETLKTENASDILPVKLKKDGDFSASSSVFEDEQLKELISHVRNLISEISTEILKGKIRVEPTKTKNRTSCEYCELSSICQFDTSFKDNGYNTLKKLTNKEVLERIGNDEEVVEKCQDGQKPNAKQ